MTATHLRRLKRVEDVLHPSEAMAQWLHKAKQEHFSLRDLLEAIKDQPEQAWPLVQLADQAETAARARLKDEARGHGRLHAQRAWFLDRGERNAVRDVATLW